MTSPTSALLADRDLGEERHQQHNGVRLDARGRRTSLATIVQGRTPPITEQSMPAHTCRASDPDQGMGSICSRRVVVR